MAFGSSRDFGLFLLGLMVLSSLLAFSIGAIILHLLMRGNRDEAQLAVLLVLLSVPLYLAVAVLRDRIRFVGWAATHAGTLWHGEPRDGFVEWWDSWVIAGMENDSYLVFDRSDTFGSLAVAEAWRKRMKLECGVAESERMWPGFFIMATYTNCPFDWPPPPATRAVALLGSAR